MNSNRTLSTVLLVTLLLAIGSNAFTTSSNPSRHHSVARFLSSEYEEQYAAATATPPPSATDSLKTELLQLATATDRGFQASSEDRKRVNGLLNALALLNPTAEPAAAYYPDLTYIPGPSITGKWTLVYTDAPDITGLANSGPTAQLGRIGQECNPPYVKNVIEWKRPSWAASLPFSGSDESRILQKVCTKATASPNDPLQLNLELAGLELVTSPDDDDDDDMYGNSSSSSMEESKSNAGGVPNVSALLESIQEKGLPVAFLKQAPLQLEGPLTAPFGKATILYLDDTMRILRTQQNYVAVNVRSDPIWF
jgi:hypothetical protein